MIRRLASARRLRLWSVAACAATLLLFFGSGRGVAQVGYRDGASVWYRAIIEHGTVTLSRDEMWVGGPAKTWNWSWTRYGFGLSTPWRPYHIAEAPWPAPSRYHAVCIPLWPIPALGLAVVLYSHGLVRGSRLRDVERCATCGYDVRGLRGLACPECGEPWRSPEL